MTSLILRLQQLIPRQGFRGNLLALLSGTTIAQVLGLACMPLLTRIYEPSAFGRFGIYFAMVAIFGTLGTGRFELTTILPESISEAKKLWRVCFLLISAFTVIMAVALWMLLPFFIHQLDNISQLEFWSSVIFGIFFIGVAESLIQWHNRLKNYRTLAIKNIIERITVIAFSIAFGLTFLFESGLIWAQNLAILSVVIFLLLKTKNDPPYSEPLLKNELFSLLNRYRDFPLMQGWSAVLLMIGTQIPTILFGSFFSIEETGHINLAYRILEAPVSLLAVSFATTYYQYTSRLSLPELRESFSKSVRFMMIYLSPVFLTFALFAPQAFRIVFGEEWLDAGRFAGPLAFLAFFKILYISQSVIFLVLRRLDLDLKINFAFLAAQLAGFFIARHLDWSPFGAILLMSIFSGLVFLLGLQLLSKDLASRDTILTQ